jgi:hypothetical protein
MNMASLLLFRNSACQINNDVSEETRRPMESYSGIGEARSIPNPLYFKPVSRLQHGKLNFRPPSWFLLAYMPRWDSLPMELLFGIYWVAHGF